jgi:hypothetical protein
VPPPGDFAECCRLERLPAAAGVSCSSAFVISVSGVSCSSVFVFSASGVRCASVFVLSTSSVSCSSVFILSASGVSCASVLVFSVSGVSCSSVFVLSVSGVRCSSVLVSRQLVDSLPLDHVLSAFGRSCSSVRPAGGRPVAQVHVTFLGSFPIDVQGRRSLGKQLDRETVRFRLCGGMPMTCGQMPRRLGEMAFSSARFLPARFGRRPVPVIPSVEDLLRRLLTGEISL